QSGLGADGGELGNDDLDFVAGVLVGPGFNFGKLRIHAGPCVLVGILPLHAASWETSASAKCSRNRPTSVTTPTACPVPRSLTLVATAGLMSTQTIFTQLGSILPVAMECSIDPRHSTRPAPFSCAA